MQYNLTSMENKLLQRIVEFVKSMLPITNFVLLGSPLSSKDPDAFLAIWSGKGHGLFILSWIAMKNKQRKYSFFQFEIESW
ncbi:hypothetical protein DFS34DRAFT_638742 [Phlyctochytrium arcticum]|nr:hypothetical protein DFS34DRAFT_641263 [Phlyctochytrium arcticum]KAI9089877.1 hypothetical protein DFS34DRAFT_638742 [Phlyctochytrium arcticum]